MKNYVKKEDKTIKIFLVLLMSICCENSIIFYD